MFLFSSAKTTKLSLVQDLWGLGHPPWERVHTGWPGKGSFPQKLALLDGMVALGAEAATVSGPVSADHLPGSMSCRL